MSSTTGTSVLLILLLNLPLLLHWQLTLILLFTLLLIAVIGFRLLGSGRWLRSLFCSTANKFLPEKFVNASGDGLIALRQLLRPPLLLTATMIGVVAWSLESLSLWMLIKGIGASNINWGEATIAHTAAGLVGALSLLPGELGRPSNYHYGAAKAALTAFCKGLQLRCQRKPFTVRTIKAGFMATLMTIDKAPKVLCGSPQSVSRDLLRRPNRRGIEYLPWWWAQIIWFIRLLPAPFASKL